MIKKYIKCTIYSTKDLLESLGQKQYGCIAIKFLWNQIKYEERNTVLCKRFVVNIDAVPPNRKTEAYWALGCLH